MGFWDFSKWGKKVENRLRTIETVRGTSKIENAKTNGAHLIFRDVEPFKEITGKYSIVKNKNTGIKVKIYDFRDHRHYSDEYEVVTDWTYKYKDYNFPDKAAYIIPKDIREEEIVFVKDLIENHLGYHYNQGGTKRLTGCKAIWKNNNLEILYDPEKDCISVVG